jgi:PII-like signaling protein
VDATIALEIAERMTGLDMDRKDPIILELVDRLETVNHYVDKVKPGSCLCSTQVIASIIAEWEREYERE